MPDLIDQAWSDLKTNPLEICAWQTLRGAYNEAGLPLQRRYCAQQLQRLDPGAAAAFQASPPSESADSYQQHLLNSSEQPTSLVPTQVANLVHLERPILPPNKPSKASSVATFAALGDQPIRGGY